MAKKSKDTIAETTQADAMSELNQTMTKAPQASAATSDMKKECELNFGNNFDLEPAQTQNTAVAHRESFELSDADMEKAKAFVSRIDINNNSGVLTYGAQAQTKLANFSDSILTKVKTKDAGDTGAALAELTLQIKDFGTTPSKGLISFFHKTKLSIEAMGKKYETVKKQIDDITDNLQNQEISLLKDAAMLDSMYEMNKTYYRELLIYIEAGKMKLEEIRNGELLDLQKKAQQTGNPADAQAAKDLSDKCEIFEKKIFDLEITKTISIQTAPQIRLIQGADNTMATKIQTTLASTIPLWKNQMTIAIGIDHAQKAAATAKMVSDATNKMLLENASRLKLATTESAKESERSIVDIETLKETNKQLLETMDEVQKIHQEGAITRRKAEEELDQIDKDLRNKLLAISATQNNQDYEATTATNDTESELRF